MQFLDKWNTVHWQINSNLLNAEWLGTVWITKGTYALLRLLEEKKNLVNFCVANGDYFVNATKKERFSTIVSLSFYNQMKEKLVCQARETYFWLKIPTIYASKDLASRVYLIKLLKN